MRSPGQKAVLFGTKLIYRTNVSGVHHPRGDFRDENRMVLVGEVEARCPGRGVRNTKLSGVHIRDRKHLYGNTGRAMGFNV